MLTKGLAAEAVNLLEKDKDETVEAIISVKEFDDEHYIVMATEKGVIKKTALSAFHTLRKKGVNALTIREGDRLIETKITDGKSDIVLGTRLGQAIRFKESDVRSMGRNAAGVRGIRLSKDDRVVGMVSVGLSGTLLTVTEKGFGKRSDIKDYRLTRRGGKGVKTVKTTDRTGKMVAIMSVIDHDDLMIITANGVLIRQNVRKIRVMSRNTQGVKLIRLDENDTIADIAKVVKENDNESGENNKDAVNGQISENDENGV